MDSKLIELLMAGAELRSPDDEEVMPVDFVIVGESRTLIATANWWQRSWGMGQLVRTLNGTPRLTDEVGQIWDFDHELGYVIAPPSDADQADFLAKMRMETDLQRGGYLRQILLLSEATPELNFTPWLEALMERPEITVAELAQEETREREIGKIRLLSGGESVLDTLVIDELGSAATLQPDGFLSAFAEQWMRYAEVDRPSIGDFVQWLSTQTPYGGDRYLTDAGVISASGDVEEIALSLGSR